MEEKIYCQECGTENDANSRYCRNCGHLLERKKSAYSDGRFTYNDYYNAPKSVPASERFGTENIDGIPIDDIDAFVGKNSDKILSKWVKMSALNKKTSFCVPLFLLTFFFGLFGSAMWFLYRKMYKIGACMFALAVLLNIATGYYIKPYTDRYVEKYSKAMEQYIEDGSGFNDDLLDETFSNPASVAAVAFTYLKSALRLALSLVLGFFGLYIYKMQMIKKLLKFPNRLSVSELSIIGGTSGGAAVLGGVLYFVVSVILSLAITIGGRLL